MHTDETLMKRKKIYVFSFSWLTSCTMEKNGKPN